MINFDDFLNENKKIKKNFIEPTQELDKKDGYLIFLGGPIQGAPDWQKDIINSFNNKNLIFATPRRSKTNNFVYDEQVDWETKYLNMSDAIVFWIPKEEEHIEGRDYAQTTRFEIGEWFGKQTNKKIILGIHKDFPGRKYFVKKFKDKYNINILSDLESIKKEIKDFLSLKKNQTWYTSDTHFGSKRALELSKRPFISVENMDMQMICNWNSIVKPDDIVYHLGDFGEYENLKYLNGKITLILGNYEIDDAKDKKISIDKYKNSLLEKGFDKVVLDLTNDNMFLTHEPLNSDKKHFNLFGHIHGRQMCKRYGMDVGVDCHNFTPIDIDTVNFYKTAIEKFYDDNVFE